MKIYSEFRMLIGIPRKAISNSLNNPNVLWIKILVISEEETEKKKKGKDGWNK